ncbi:MAG: substrate-binding domain-containing protein [Mangrovimonas sp.]|nr:substrate-binding domain-containing protein [Mangrovimonas sp.]
MFNHPIKCVLLLFLVSFLACKSNKNSHKINIAFSQGLGSHPLRTAMNHSMEIQASLHEDVNLAIYKAENNIKKQIEDIQKSIDFNADVIIVSPIDPDSISPIIEKAYDKGIPIIILDRKINSEKYTSYIGADNLKVGNQAGDYIASFAKQPINVVEIKGEDTSFPTQERSKGFHQVVDGLANINLMQSFKGLPEEEFKTLLDSVGNNINFIFAFNDDLASQAWEMARRVGVENNIKFIGADGLNGESGGIEMVLNGKLAATILYPPGGAEAIETAVKIYNNEPVARRIVLGTTVIDRFNADIMKNQFDKINEQQATIENQVSAIKKQEQLYYSQNNLLKLSIAILAVILGLAIYSVYLIFTIRKKNRQLTLTNEKITVQRNQIEKIANEVKESNEAKLNFFTGLSHEFKTPITLILSSIESLKESYANKVVKLPYEIELVNKNSNRLLRLINNLLDFRKIEDKMFNMRASKTNVYNFTFGIYRDFESEAKRRSIDFKISTNNKDLELFFDRNLMDKVYFNLLSNAFKFTPDNGKIEISIYDNVEGNNAAIHFKDNGIGIPQEEIEGVFEPFFKGSNNRKNSSGIGLHLSKQFIELHLGKIEVKSYHGTEFIITLYKGNTHFNEDQIITEAEVVDANQLQLTSDIEPLEELLTDSFNEEEDTDKYTILLIEDNKDLSFFLKNKLQAEFQVLLSDGTDAEKKAFENIPDIVICDVNLPEKSGFEICKLLKADLRTSHIPTIILTALGNKESYVQGLASGADLYLTKPFSYPILMQSIKSLLYNREKLRYYYTNNIPKLVSNKSFGNDQQEFVSKLNTFINSNIDNSNYSVEDLASHLNISRVQLYRKAKAIFGIGISDYINNFKLESSKGMLENTQMSVSEIAYKNGFSSPNYFSTVFKNKYGVTPNTYRKTSE